MHNSASLKSLTISTLNDAQTTIGKVVFQMEIKVTSSFIVICLMSGNYSPHDFDLFQRHV